MSVNRKIVDELIACKQNYDKLYLEFPFKNDLEALFKHEYDYYLTPIFTNIVPMIYKETKVNPDTEIDDYFPFIVYKYHEIVKKEVLDFEKNNAAIIRGMAKQILESFLQQLMLLSKDDKKKQQDFIANHFKQNAREWMLLFRSNPLLGLETCAKLRNPIMQNTVMTYMEKPIKAFIETKSWETFEEELLKYFIYPLDVSLNEYYDKWIAKEAIHVKFASKILGSHYEKAKTILKEAEKAENYRRKQEHYERVQRKYKKLEQMEKLKAEEKNKE